MQFILGPILMVIGVLLMRYTVEVSNFTGQIDWADKLFSAGFGAGTYTFWRLCGLLTVIVAALWTFGMLDLIVKFFSWLFGFGGH